MDLPNKWMAVLRVNHAVLFLYIQPEPYHGFHYPSLHQYFRWVYLYPFIKGDDRAHEPPPAGNPEQVVDSHFAGGVGLPFVQYYQYGFNRMVPVIQQPLPEVYPEQTLPV